MQSQAVAAMHTIRDGARRVNGAPAVLAGMWILTIAVTLEAAYALDIHPVWNAVDLVHAVVAQPGDGAALTLYTRPGSVGAAAAAWVIIWLFLAGGILDRYARDRATRAFGFFGACGGLFPRFFRLAVIQTLIYAVVVRSIVVPRASIAAFVAIGLVFDYAKVRLVVEDRRSAVGAIGAAVAFLKRNLVSAALMYAIELVLLVVVAAAFRSIGGGEWNATAIVYVGARLWTRLLFWASETALFQSRLAHAGYVARPEAVWPDAPVAEGLR